MRSAYRWQSFIAASAAIAALLACAAVAFRLIAYGAGGSGWHALTSANAAMFAVFWACAEFRIFKLTAEWKP